MGLLLPQASFNRDTLGLALDAFSGALADGLGGSDGVTLMEDAGGGGATVSSTVDVVGCKGGEKCRGREFGGVRGRTTPVGGGTTSTSFSFSVD